MEARRMTEDALFGGEAFAAFLSTWPARSSARSRRLTGLVGLGRAARHRSRLLPTIHGGRASIRCCCSFLGAHLSFLGGVRWGLAHARPQRQPARSCLAVVPPLVGWAAIAVPAPLRLRAARRRLRRARRLGFADVDACALRRTGSGRLRIQMTSVLGRRARMVRSCDFLQSLTRLARPQHAAGDREDAVGADHVGHQARRAGTARHRRGRAR